MHGLLSKVRLHALCPFEKSRWRIVTAYVRKFFYCYFAIFTFHNCGIMGVRIEKCMHEKELTRIGNRFFSLDCWYSPTKSHFFFINLRIFFAHTLVPTYIIVRNKSYWAFMDLNIFLTDGCSCISRIHADLMQLFHWVYASSESQYQQWSWYLYPIGRRERKREMKEQVKERFNAKRRKMNMSN